MGCHTVFRYILLIRYFMLFKPVPMVDMIMLHILHTVSCTQDSYVI